MEEKTGNCLLRVMNWQFTPKVNTKQGAELQYCLVVIQIFYMTGKLHYLGWGRAGENQAIITSLKFFCYPWTCVGEQKCSFCGLKIIYCVIIRSSLFSLMLEPSSLNCIV